MLKQTLKHAVLDTVTRVMGDKDGRVTLPVLAGPGKGLRLSLDLSRRIETGYFLGTYDVKQVTTFARLLKPGGVVWDIGPYLGYYSAVASRFVGKNGQVIAFEPDPVNLARCHQNMELNSISNVRFLHTAIGAPIGTVTLIKTPNTNSHIDGAYIGRDREDYATRKAALQEELTVRCMSIDEAYLDASIPNPDVIKIDIEGAEQFALEHTDLIAAGLKPVIMLELHNPECDRAAWKFAERTGYRLFSLEIGRYFEKESEVHGTCLCIHPDSAAPIDPVKAFV